MTQSDGELNLSFKYPLSELEKISEIRVILLISDANNYVIQTSIKTKTNEKTKNRS